MLLARRLERNGNVQKIRGRTECKVLCVTERAKSLEGHRTGIRNVTGGLITPSALWSGFFLTIAALIRVQYNTPYATFPTYHHLGFADIHCGGDCNNVPTSRNHIPSRWTLCPVLAFRNTVSPMPENGRTHPASARGSRRLSSV